MKITLFETKILDNHGERLKGLDGLTMLLVDVDYDGMIFDMDRTVFAGLVLTSAIMLGFALFVFEESRYVIPL